MAALARDPSLVWQAAQTEAESAAPLAGSGALALQLLEALAGLLPLSAGSLTHGGLPASGEPWRRGVAWLRAPVPERHS